MSATKRWAVWPRSRLIDRQKKGLVMTAGLARARVTGRWGAGGCAVAADSRLEGAGAASNAAVDARRRSSVA